MRSRSRRIAQVLEELAVRRGPRRQHSIQPSARSGVRIHVGGDVDAFRARRLDARYRVGHLAPVGLARRLEVVNLDRQMRLAPDTRRLVDPFQQRVALGAHVGDIEAAMLAHDTADLDQLLGRDVGIGRIDQRVGDAERAILHRLGHHPAHRRQLLAGRRPHAHAAGVLAQRPAAQERADVGRHAAFGHRPQPVAEPLPAASTLDPVRDEAAHGGGDLAEGILDLAAGRRGRPAFAHDLGRDALRHLREAARVVHQREDAVAEDVDEAGADDHAGGIHHLAGRIGRQTSGRRDRGDAVAGEGDIAVEPGIARPIHDARPANQHVDLSRRVPCRHDAPPCFVRKYASASLEQ